MITKNILIFLLFTLYNVSTIHGFSMRLVCQCFGFKSSKMCCNNQKYVKMSPNEYEGYHTKLFQKSFHDNWRSSYSYVYDSDNTLIGLLPVAKYQNKEFFYNKSCVNSHMAEFIFPGCGGKTQRFFDNSIPNKLIPIEVNFFQYNIRSLIILYYKVNENHKIHLDSIQIVPFRNATGSTIGYVPPLKSFDQVIDSMYDSWYGERTWYEPNEHSVSKRSLKTFNMFPYLSTNKNIIKQVYEDGLVIVVPKEIIAGEHFRMVFGAMVNISEYKQLIMNYNTHGNITRWTYDTYRLTKR